MGTSSNSREPAIGMGKTISRAHPYSSRLAKAPVQPTPFDTEPPWLGTSRTARMVQSADVTLEAGAPVLLASVSEEPEDAIRVLLIEDGTID